MRIRTRPSTKNSGTVGVSRQWRRICSSLASVSVPLSTHTLASGTVLRISRRHLYTRCGGLNTSVRVQP